MTAASGTDGPAAPVRVSLWTIAREWTRLGCTGFGGPPTHIALLRRMCVEERGWIDATEFEDGIATTNLLPGPASTQLAILAGQITDFVESYYIAARALETVTAPVSDKDLVRRVHELGEKMFFTGEVRRREACLRANFTNAIAYFRERGLLVEKDKKLSLGVGVDSRRTATEIEDLLPPSA